MSGGDPAGISGAVEELRAELDRISAAMPGERPGAPAGQVRRMQAARAVMADPAPGVRPGRLRGPRRALKRLLRRGLRWHSADVLDFAIAATDFAAVAAERQAEVERALAGVRERLGRIERRLASGEAPRPAPAAPGAAPPRETAAPAPPPGLDYFAFEGLMRGSREEIAARQARYVAEFAGLDDVLDAGCGRGEFLELLREAGTRARGVDADPDMVARCREAGLDVAEADAVEHLAGLAGAGLGGVFAAQVVEHLPPERLLAFLAAAHEALAPDGVVLLETINPASLSALRNYFADLTHAQPLVPETLSFLVESAGFRDARIEYASPVPEGGRLIEVPFGDSVPPEALAASRRNVDLLNGLLFAPQDYAVIARR